MVNTLAEVESRKSQVCTVFRVSNGFLGIKLWQDQLRLTSWDLKDHMWIVENFDN